jgi:2-desacetyl-2-hydroxyethyl bacteriochlorophyllide A dehydrogenase
MKGFRVVAAAQGEVEEMARPDALPGQALIRVEYAGICGGDPNLFALNTYGATPERPLVYGHEFVGVVEKINNPEGLPSRVEVGDRVVAHQDRPCNVCRYCISGKPSICSGEYGKRDRSTGCFAEYLTRDLPYIFKINDNVASRVAVLAEPLSVAVYDVRQSQLKRGDRVLIIGGGTIGILIALIAQCIGVNDILFFEIVEKKIRLLHELGFSAVNPQKVEIVGSLKKRFGVDDVHCVFEVSGAQASYEAAFKSVAPLGKVVLIALPPGERMIDFDAIYKKKLQVISVNSHQLDDFSLAVDLINAGKLNSALEKIVTGVFPLDDLKNALAASKNRELGHVKVLVDCDSMGHM